MLPREKKFWVLCLFRECLRLPLQCYKDHVGFEPNLVNSSGHQEPCRLGLRVYHCPFWGNLWLKVCGKSLDISFELKWIPLKITAKQQVLQAVITTELLFALVDSCQDKISISCEIFHISHEVWDSLDSQLYGFACLRLLVFSLSF